MSTGKETQMADAVNVGLLVRIEALPGQEAAVESFLTQALPLVQQEPATITWYAIRLGPSTFGIFDTFPDQDGRRRTCPVRSPPRSWRTWASCSASPPSSRSTSWRPSCRGSVDARSRPTRRSHAPNRHGGGRPSGA